MIKSEVRAKTERSMEIAGGDGEPLSGTELSLALVHPRWKGLP